MKIEERVKTHHSSLQKKVEALQDRKNNTLSVDSSSLEESQVSLHLASVQLNVLNSVIDSLMNKEGLAKTLKQDLAKTKD